MRGLQSHDVFMAFRVLKASGIKEEFKEVALAVQSGKLTDAREIGAEFLLDLFAAAGDERTEKAIYEMLSGPLEIPAAELAKMEPLALIDMVKGLKDYIDTEAWKAFFDSVASLIK